MTYNYPPPYNCNPSYSYRPQNFAPIFQCSAAFYIEHRARVAMTFEDAFFQIDGMFYRSVQQSTSANYLEIECTTTQFNVYYFGTLVEVYSIFIGAGGLSDLRTKLETSQYIEMPTLGFDIFDPRDVETDDLTTFAPTALEGGVGPPTDDATIGSINTGPERTLVMVITTEDEHGNPVTPGVGRIRQWNGFAWIPYFSNGDCKLVT